MATVIAEANNKPRKVVKNVKPRDVEGKVEKLYNQGYTRVSVDWGKTK